MSAPGSVISFEYAGEVQDPLTGVRVFAPAVSLGGVQSLTECPEAMTQARIPVRERRRRGIVDNLMRLSIGIEDAADLVSDLVSAMSPR